ncbi:hypothetical protein GCM10027612_68770 [Microbispora bryophytorum subsp. camponoti]
MVDPQGRVRAATPAVAGKPAMATFRPPAPLRKAAREVCGGVFGAGRCHIVVAQQVYDDGGDWTVYSAAPVQGFDAPPPCWPVWSWDRRSSRAPSRTARGAV